jgi:hypothetical protein
MVDHKYHFVVVEDGGKDLGYHTREQALSRFKRRVDAGIKQITALERRGGQKWYIIAKKGDMY